MAGVSRLLHMAAMSPAGRGSIATEEAREVLARLAALEAVVAVADEIYASGPDPSTSQWSNLGTALDALDALDAEASCSRRHEGR